jgi:UDP:flavonoid glycosyltransferase YjiC (YdhE family)
MRLFFSTFGTEGDVLPFAHLAKILIDRGQAGAFLQRTERALAALRSPGFATRAEAVGAVLRAERGAEIAADALELCVAAPTQ